MGFKFGFKIEFELEGFFKVKKIFSISTAFYYLIKFYEKDDVFDSSEIPENGGK